MRIDFWNMLHDGGIQSRSGEVPGDLTLRVGIEYLTDLLPTEANHIVVGLLGCTRFDLYTWDDDPVESLCAVGHPGDTDLAEILSAEESDGVAKVTCVHGYLHAVYDDVRLSLAEGDHLPIEELDDASNRYWGVREKRRQEAADRRRTDASG